MAGELLCPWRKRFCCTAFLLRTAETAFRRSKICRQHQPHLDFTKPPKLGHSGACSLENDSLALYYLSEDFILLLTSPSSSPLPPLSSFSVPFYLPPTCPRCCSGVGGMERRWRQGGRVLQQSAFIFSLQGCCIRGKTQRAAAVIQQNIGTVHHGCILYSFTHHSHRLRFCWPTSCFNFDQPYSQKLLTDKYNQLL